MFEDIEIVAKSIAYSLLCLGYHFGLSKGSLILLKVIALKEWLTTHISSRRDISTKEAGVCSSCAWS